MYNSDTMLPRLDARYASQKAYSQHSSLTPLQTVAASRAFAVAAVPSLPASKVFCSSRGSIRGVWRGSFDRRQRGGDYELVEFSRRPT